MANIRDVAKHAGVAIATVSATLNESAPVSEETRRRVWAAVDAVGYSPNAIARSLRLGKSRLIGIGHRRHHQPVLLIDGADDGERGDRRRLFDHRLQYRRRR